MQISLDKESLSNLKDWFENYVSAFQSDDPEIRQDFKLLQISWIFDINFKPTMECIKRRRYLDKIRNVLPKSKETDEIFDMIERSF